MNIIIYISTIKWGCSDGGAYNEWRWAYTRGGPLQGGGSTCISREAYTTRSTNGGTASGRISHTMIYVHVYMGQETSQQHLHKRRAQLGSAHCLPGLDAMSQRLPRNAGRASHVLVGAVGAAADQSCVQREGEREREREIVGGETHT